VSARTRFSPSGATERSVGQQGTRPWRWGRNASMAATSRARVGGSDILSNTCHASLCLTWRPFLGLLGSDFGYGPIMKVVHFVMPYNSCLRTLIIGAMD
jgi:hypothetical protein